MAQTVLSGTTGNVTLPTGTGAKIATWSASFQQNVNDTTGFVDDVWGTSLGSNAIKLHGSLGGFLTKGTTSDQPGITTGMTQSGIAITLTADTGCTFTFTGVVSDINVSQDRMGNGSYSMNFVSSGTVTEAWVTT